MKRIYAKCEKCNWNSEVTDSDPEFDNLVELDECPDCKKKGTRF